MGRAITMLFLLAICGFFILTKRGGGKRGIIARTYARRDVDEDDENDYYDRRDRGDRDIHTKIAGVSFDNNDGTSRQAILKALRPGDRLLLQHAPMPGHPEAIQVVTSWGRQAGFLPSGMGRDVLRWFNEYKVDAYVTEITGGTWDKPIRLLLL